MDLKKELEGVVDALVASDVPFGVCGGVAVTIHGAPRFTKDIDLIVLPGDVEAALGAVRSVGFTLSAGPMMFAAGTAHQREVRRVSKVDGTELLMLDFLLVTAALRTVWDSRVIVEWEGRRVPVVSRRGLITMKKLAGRPLDLADVEALERLDGSGEEH